MEFLAELGESWKQGEWPVSQGITGGSYIRTTADSEGQLKAHGVESRDCCTDL